MLAEIPLGGNIVAERKIGNTRVLICDAAYADAPPERLRRVLEEAARASLNIVLRGREDRP